MVMLGGYSSLLCSSGWIAMDVQNLKKLDLGAQLAKGWAALLSIWH